MDGGGMSLICRHILARRAVCTGTEAQKQSLRAYFLTRSVSEVAQLSHRWTAVGQEISKIIAGVPWMLEVFLACGYGRAYLPTMFIQVLKHGHREAFLNIIQYPPLSDRFAVRRLCGGGDDAHYKYVWTHYVPVMRGAILDTYLRREGLVIDGDVFLSIIPSLSPTQMQFIIDHPYHRDLVYTMSSPYEFVEAQVRQTYKYDACIRDPHIAQVYGIWQYKEAERLWLYVKKRRRARNWRFLFWCAVLHSRMMEFRERYWALTGKRVRAAAAEFYALSGGAACTGKN